MSKRDTGNTNEGIQGAVTADVVAVGRGARATKIVGSERAHATDEAIRELREAIAKLQIQPKLSKEISESLDAVHTETKKEKSDTASVKSHVLNVLDKLKVAGVVVAEVAAIIEPIKKIALLFHIALPLL